MKGLFVFVFSIVVFGVFAQDDFKPIQNSENIKNEFESKSGNLKTIKSDFTQEKHLAYLSSNVMSKGKFWFKKENKLRWEYTEPFKYLVLVNGEEITVQDEHNTSVYKKKPNKTFQHLNEILSSSVNGTLINDSRYAFNVMENSDYFKVELLPNIDATKEVITSIQLLFMKSTMAVYKIIMFEPNGDSITITFDNKEVNTPIKDGMFIVK